MTRAEILNKLDILRDDIKRPTRNAANDENFAPIQFTRLHDWSNKLDEIIIVIARGDIK